MAKITNLQLVDQDYKKSALSMLKKNNMIRGATIVRAKR